jgi:6-phosphogluconolactonase
MSEQPLDSYQAGAVAEVTRPARILVGGYAGTDTPCRGIASLGIEPDTGDLVPDGSYTDVPNPFHLVRAPSGQVVYVASNVAQGRVFALRLDDTGALTPLNDQPTGGAGTVHLGLGPGGRHLFAADHDSGSIAVLPIGPDGSLGPVAQSVQHIGSGPNPDAQRGPHPHMAVLDPTGTRLLVPDKGTDYVHVYLLDAATGELAPDSQVHLGSGVGPRQLVFGVDGRHAYVVSELMSTITICRYDPWTGALWTVGSAPTVPPGSTVWNAPSAMVVSADGRFVYAANRGHESVAVLAVQEGGSELRLIANQPLGSPVSMLPWDIILDPAGDRLYVANQLAGSVVTLAVDRTTGLLAPTGSPVAVPTPACLTLF